MAAGAALISAWLVRDALKTGRTYIRGFEISRAGAPRRFWAVLLLYAAMGVATVAAAAADFIERLSTGT